MNFNQLTDENIIEELKKFKEIKKKDLAEATAKLTENPVYHFAWVGEDLYKAAQMIDYIVEAIQIAEHRKAKGDEGKNIANAIYDYYLRRIVKDRLMDRSTNHLHSYTSLWEKEVIGELLQWLK